MQNSIPPKLEYGMAAPRGRTILVIAIAAMLPLAIWFWLPVWWPNRVRVSYSWQRCTSNLRQIGQGILLYSNEYKGAYPDSFLELIQYEEVLPETFVCSSSNDTTARAPSMQATLNVFAQPGHCSYIYLGAGLTASTASPDTVVAYESLSNHSDPGAAVLFGDGSARIVDQQWMNQLNAKLVSRGSTTKPITLPPPAMAHRY